MTTVATTLEPTQETKTAFPAAVPRADHALAIVEVLVGLQDCHDLHHACSLLAQLLKQQLGCDRVCVGIKRAGAANCRLEAISGMNRFDRQSQMARLYESAMDETLVREQPAMVVGNGDRSPPATLAHRRCLRESAVTLVASCPIVDSQGNTIGVLLVLDSSQSNQAEPLQSVLEQICRRVGPCLALFQRTDVGPIGRAARTGRAKLRTRKGRLVLIAGAALLGLLAVPMPYKIGCDCQLQPVQRRFVAAPFDGKLERVHVKAGEVIARGELLATLDGREIRWELAGLNAELDRARKQRDAALAKQNTAAAQQAKLEMERLELKRLVLDEHISKLTIVSPIDGVVVQAELENAEGAPLKIGQILFEVAPLAEMIVEVAIPEEEIAHVRPQMDVTMRLDAYPQQSWSGRINKIHPRAEIHDAESVFVAEVALENPDDILRPGMNGRATIISPRHALAWNLFHKPWESLQGFVGW